MRHNILHLHKYLHALAKLTTAEGIELSRQSGRVRNRTCWQSNSELIQKLHLAPLVSSSPVTKQKCKCDELLMLYILWNFSDNFIEHFSIQNWFIEHFSDKVIQLWFRNWITMLCRTNIKLYQKKGENYTVRILVYRGNIKSHIDAVELKITQTLSFAWWYKSLEI